MKLVNVRLNAEDALLVAELRGRGVSISDVVRRALRAEVLDPPSTPIDPARALEGVMSRFPTPPQARSEKPAPARDARAARRLIRKRLRRRR